MARTAEVVMGEYVDLIAGNSLLMSLDVSSYEKIRVVVENVGGDADIDAIQVHASHDSTADPDMDETRGWIQVAGLDDFTPSIEPVAESVGSWVMDPVLWRKIRVSASKPAASPALSIKARCAVIGVPWSS